MLTSSANSSLEDILARSHSADEEYREQSAANLAIDPDPTAASTLVPPTRPAVTMSEKQHSMDSALADLAPISAQVDAGPAIKKVDEVLDAAG